MKKELVSGHKAYVTFTIRFKVGKTYLLPKYNALGVPTLKTYYKSMTYKAKIIKRRLIEMWYCKEIRHSKRLFSRKSYIKHTLSKLSGFFTKNEKTLQSTIICTISGNNAM